MDTLQDVAQESPVGPEITIVDDGNATHVITIPVHATDAFMRKMASLSKRAARLGSIPPTATLVKNSRRMEKQETSIGEVVRGDSGSVLQETGKSVHSVDVQDWEISSEQVKLPDNYRYCGRIEHTERGNALFAAGGAELDKEWHDAPSGCSHCSTQRNRADTFIVADSSGKQVQVGRNCLRDFFSGRTATFLAQQFEFQSNIVTILDDFEKECFGRYGRFSACHETETVMAQAANVIRREGFLSRSKAAASRELGGREIATADKVSDLVRLSGTPMWASVNEVEKPTDEDREKAAEIMRWLSELQDDPANPFLTQLAIIGRQGFVAESQLGIACAAYSARERAERAKVHTERPDYGYYGEPGKRAQAEVEVAHVIPIEGGNFGPKEIVKLQVLGSGQELVWFTSAGSFAEKGKKYVVKLTPAKHEEYKGRKQTSVKRVACVRELEMAVENPPALPSKEISPAVADEPPMSPADIKVTPADVAALQAVTKQAAEAMKLQEQNLL